MKRLGRILCIVAALMLTVSSFHAEAKTKSKSVHAETRTNMAGRDFNHMATGFPLYGGHATAACETCHVAGVFQGTPRACDGCHAQGNRVGATPKSTSHIVTNAPCETCHFNTSTFLGARYNHGTAVPGQCASCHNGRIATGRPASHNIGLKATDSCDHCHRSFVWLPSSWNHVGVAPHSCDSAGCHMAGFNQYFKPANHQTTPYMDRNTFYCDECHNYYSWFSSRFVHDRPSPSGICMGCHDGSNAPGKSAGHTVTADDCISCHTSTISWLGALAGKPANHVTYAAGVPCSVCHTGAAIATGAALHTFLSTTCNSCHYRGMVVYAPNHPLQQSSHEGNKNCSSSSCHAPLGREGSSYITWGG